VGDLFRPLRSLHPRPAVAGDSLIEEKLVQPHPPGQSPELLPGQIEQRRVAREHVLDPPDVVAFRYGHVGQLERVAPDLEQGLGMAERQRASVPPWIVAGVHQDDHIGCETLPELAEDKQLLIGGVARDSQIDRVDSAPRVPLERFGYSVVRRDPVAEGKGIAEHENPKLARGCGARFPVAEAERVRVHRDSLLAPEALLPFESSARDPTQGRIVAPHRPVGPQCAVLRK
jgi:hypothetical protein